MRRLTIIPVLETDLLRANDAGTDEDGNDEEDGNADDFDSASISAQPIYDAGSIGDDLQREPKFNFPVYQDASQT